MADKNQKRKHSVLEKHNVTLDDKQRTAVTFYSYYNNETPIYYGLEPLIKLFKFTKELEMMNSIPRMWVKRVSEFDDPIFMSGNKRFAPDALFVDASGIAFLISLSENKALTSTVTNLYNICIRKTENDRVHRINTIIVTLENEVQSLRRQFDDHSSTTSGTLEALTGQQSFIKSAIELIVENHSAIQAVLADLIGKL